MGIFGNLFAGQRAAHQQQAAAPAAAPAAATPAPPPPTTDSQLAEMAALWKIDPSKVPVAPAAGGYFANVDPKKVAAAVGSMDFTAGVTPEILARVKDGDTSAIQEMLNASNRATMQAMMMALPGIITPVLQQAEQRAATAAVGNVKNQRLGEMTTGDAVLDSPAFKPMVDAMKQVHAINNPQLSPEQVTQVVTGNVKKMLEVAQQATAAPAAAAATKKSQETSYGFLF